MLEPISQKLPEDIKTSLEPISGLDIHYVAISLLAIRLLSKRKPKLNKLRREHNPKLRVTRDC
jgi:hypothetical protein